MLTLRDTVTSAIVKLAGGNPGATVALAELAGETVSIDPHAGLGPLHYLFGIEDLELTGPETWVLYKDVCKNQIVNMVTLLRGNQLGFIQTDDILSAIRTARPGPSIPAFDFPEIISQVQAVVPDFATKK